MYASSSVIQPSLVQIMACHPAVTKPLPFFIHLFIYFLFFILFYFIYFFIYLFFFGGGGVVSVFVKHEPAIRLINYPHCSTAI